MRVRVRVPSIPRSAPSTAVSDDQHQLVVGKQAVVLAADDVVADQDEAAEQQASDRPADQRVPGQVVIEPREVAADRSEHLEGEVHRPRAVEDRPAEESERHRDDPGEDHLYRPWPLVEERRQQPDHEKSLSRWIVGD